MPQSTSNRQTSDTDRQYRNTENREAGRSGRMPHAAKHSASGAGIFRSAVRKNPGITAALIALIAASAATGVMPPLALSRLVDRLSAGSITSAGLIAPALLYFALTASAGLLTSVREVLITVFGQKVTHQVRTSMSEKLIRLPASYYADQESGVTVSRFVNDVGQLETLFSSGVISMFADSCTIISILIVVRTMSPGLFLLLLLCLPLLFLLTRSFQRRMLSAQLDNRAAVARANQILPETVANRRTIGVFRRWTFMEDRYHRSVEDGFQAMERSNFYDSTYSPIILTVSALLVAVMMGLSVSQTGVREFFGMTVGTIVALIAYVGQIFSPLQSIGMEIQNIQSALAGMRRIQEFLQEDEREIPAETLQKDGREILSEAKDSSGADAADSDSPLASAKAADSDAPLPSAAAAGPDASLPGTSAADSESLLPGTAAVNSEEIAPPPAIELADVTFGYDPERPVLRDFSLTVSSGEMVTLMGRTGIGKSTCFKLILGLYTPQEGSVRIFGRSADQIPDSERRRLIGCVQQNAVLLQGSVRDQITLRDPSVTEEMVWHALDMTGLAELFRQLPEGLDTPCRPELFSQGQRQLLAIARAVVCDPRILLLDEITANLDSLTESQVLAALRSASGNRAVLSISHRLYEQKGGRKVELH